MKSSAKESYVEDCSLRDLLTSILVNFICRTLEIKKNVNNPHSWEEPDGYISHERHTIPVSSFGMLSGNIPQDMMHDKYQRVIISRLLHKIG